MVSKALIVATGFFLFMFSVFDKNILLMLVGVALIIATSILFMMKDELREWWHEVRGLTKAVSVRDVRHVARGEHLAVVFADSELQEWIDDNEVKLVFSFRGRRHAVLLFPNHAQRVAFELFASAK